jgi:hypothetical protein
MAKVSGLFEINNNLNKKVRGHLFQNLQFLAVKAMPIASNDFLSKYFVIFFCPSLTLKRNQQYLQ